MGDFADVRKLPSPAPPVDQVAMNAEADRRRKAMVQARSQVPPVTQPTPTLGDYWEKTKDILGFGKVKKQLNAAGK